MAKYECTLQGDFDTLLKQIDKKILSGSLSATLEDSSDYSSKGIQCAVRVYERYSTIGKSRVSLSITLLGDGDQLFVSAISSGGSQAVLFKINTFGEESFVQCVIDIIKQYKKATNSF